MRKYILNARGEPVLEDNSCRWAEWFEEASRTGLRRVARTEIADLNIIVSTVFISLDHSFEESGDPVLWETIVFGGPLNGEQDRYTSLKASFDGHLAMLERVRHACGLADLSSTKSEFGACIEILPMRIVDLG